MDKDILISQVQMVLNTFIEMKKTNNSSMIDLFIEKYEAQLAELKQGGVVKNHIAGGVYPFVDSSLCKSYSDPFIDVLGNTEKMLKEYLQEHPNK